MPPPKPRPVRKSQRFDSSSERSPSPSPRALTHLRRDRDPSSRAVESDNDGEDLVEEEDGNAANQEEQEEVSEGDDDPEDSQVPNRRYNTRPSTQTLHPAVTLGLAPRRRQDIQAAAAQRKAEKEAERVQRERVKSLAAERVAGGVINIARMQEERRIADLRKAANNRRPPPGIPASGTRPQQPPPEPSSPLPSMGAGHTQNIRRRKRGGPPGIPASIFNREHTARMALNPQRVRSRSASPISRPNTPMDLDMHQWANDPQLENAQLAEQYPLSGSSDDDHGLPDVDKCNRRLHDDHEYSDDDREYDDREDNNGPYSDGQYDDTIDANDHDPSGKYDSGGITKTQEGLDEEWQEDDGDDTHTHTRVSGKKKALSHKERKAITRNNILGQLDDARHATAMQLMVQTQPVDATGKRPRSHTADSMSAPSAPKKHKHAGPVLRANWRDTDQQPLGPKPSRALTSAQRPHTPSIQSSRQSPASHITAHGVSSGGRRWRDMLSADEGDETPTRPIRTYIKPPHRQRSNQVDDDEIEGEALDTADVSLSRNDAIHAARQRRSMKSLIAVEQVNSDDELNPQRTQKAKRTRTRKADMPVGQSRSSENIPNFFVNVMYAEFIPTLLDYCGSKQNPFNMKEEGNDEFLQTCQSLVDALCPDEEYTLTKSDAIYKVAQQEMYNWRSGFVARAVWVLETAIAAKFGPQPAVTTVREWIGKMSSKTGPAFWQKPATAKSKAEGKLGSIYITKTFSWHLAKIKGSCGDYGYPGGALALSAAGMEHALGLFKSGQQLPGPKFGGKKVKAITQDWYDKAVSHLVPPNEEKFDAIILVSKKYMNVGLAASQKQAAQVDDLDVFDRSSPPIQLSDAED